MKKRFFLCLLLPFLAFQCKEIELPNTAQVKLVFKPIYDGQPLVFNQVYTIDGKKVRFTRLSFFTSTERVNNSVDAIKKGSFVQFLDFSDLDQAAKSAIGISKTISLISGDQSSFLLNLGVAMDLNAKKPIDYSTETALSEGANYWDDWKSYIFLKLEGSMDKDGDGRFETGITLHTGGNEAFRTLNFAKTYTVKDDVATPTTLNFSLNINTLLRGIDLATVNASHQTGDKPTMLKLMDNLRDALLLN